jgi:hypothetical protein
MLLLLDDGNGCPAAQRARVRHRLTARFQAGRLDRALAGGVSPDASAPLALRAQRLLRPAVRRDLAASAERILAAARQPSAARLAVPPHRERVAAAAAGLRALIGRLSDPGPVSVRGIAEASILLTDASGPLYSRHSELDLDTGVWHALDALCSFTRRERPGRA